MKTKKTIGYHIRFSEILSPILSPIFLEDRKLTLVIVEILIRETSWRVQIMCTNI